MRLADFIAANRDAILAEWACYARRIPAAHAMNLEQLRDHARDMLDAIVADLNAPQSADEQFRKSQGEAVPRQGGGRADSGAERHAAGRAGYGFSVEEVVSEFRALRASVLRLWARSARSAKQSDLDDMTRFNEAIDQALAESVARHASVIREAQDIFLGILGHDLRDPLGAVTMSAQFLLRSESLDARHVKAAAMIYSSGQQMSSLIADLLVFTRTRLGQGMPVRCGRADLGAIARQAVAQAGAYHPERTILLDLAPALGGEWDGARIAQVFSNLIGNAIKHGDSRAPVRVSVEEDGDTLVARVHNEGEPIPERVMGDIFEPMRRVAAAAGADRYDAGLGLGLYIASEIVRAHGGSIGVESTREAGTSFTVRLPRRSAAAPQAAA